ncbi:uncharacterized protein TNCV_3495341 [Trichonephila clavipes]|nr:uncharacterized protein TNCV_3495341 [Trichonephila clavipes]
MQIISIIAQKHFTGDLSPTHKRYIREEQIGYLKYGKYFLLRVFCVSCLPIPRGRHRTSFDQVSEFDRGRIVPYRDCGLCFREIGHSGVRNQATVMRICHLWMQEETTGLIAPTSLLHHLDCAHGSDRSRSHSTTKFSLLRIIRCPLVPFDAVCSRMECPQDVYCFIYP